MLLCTRKVDHSLQSFRRYFASVCTVSIKTYLFEIFVKTFRRSTLQRTTKHVNDRIGET